VAEVPCARVDAASSGGLRADSVERHEQRAAGKADVAPERVEELLAQEVAAGEGVERLRLRPCVVARPRDAPARERVVDAAAGPVDVLDDAGREAVLVSWTRSRIPSTST